MAKTKTPTPVFYSWQSDLPKKTNLNAIRKALEGACKRLNASRSDVKLVPDEATRDTSGSPNIALKILEKIEASAIFIADITTITAPGADRPCPNPNVGYELGYAVATLGWDRVILLFNGALATFPDDLPFDFIQNRASPYHYGPADPSTKRDELSAFLETAIEAVLNRNPKRPAELRGLTREKIEHDSDVENMRWLMESIHLPTLQDHIDEMPHMITDRALWFHDHFRGVVESTLFSLYDPVLDTAVEQLRLGWTSALSHTNRYHSNSGGTAHIFSNPGDAPLSPDQQTSWDAIEASRREMAQAQHTILARLRADYLEIKLHTTNAKAWKDYVAFQQSLAAPAKGVGKKAAKAAKTLGGKKVRKTLGGKKAGKAKSKAAAAGKPVKKK